MQNTNACCIQECERQVYNKRHQLCNAHYLRLKRTGTPLGKKGQPVRTIGIQGICTTIGCNREIHHKTLLLCQRCYGYWRTHHNPSSKLCSIDGCSSPHSHKGYCASHAHRLRRYGNPLAGPGRGSPGKRRGILKLSGENITSNGYKKIRIESGDNKIRWVLEHRHVMGQVLGRDLLSDENVHHKDGNRLNNKPENLELWIKPQPNGVRVEDAVKWAKEIIHRYKSLTF